MQDKIGVTLTVLPYMDPLPVYESSDGFSVFVTDDPYLLADGTSLQEPIPVVIDEVNGMPVSGLETA